MNELGRLGVSEYGWLVIPDDVTALEAARLAELLAKIVAAETTRTEHDPITEIKKLNLERFFQPFDPTISVGSDPEQE